MDTTMPNESVPEPLTDRSLAGAFLDLIATGCLFLAISFVLCFVLRTVDVVLAFVQFVSHSGRDSVQPFSLVLGPDNWIHVFSHAGVFFLGAHQAARRCWSDRPGLASFLAYALFLAVFPPFLHRSEIWSAYTLTLLVPLLTAPLGGFYGKHVFAKTQVTAVAAERSSSRIIYILRQKPVRILVLGGIVAALFIGGSHFNALCRARAEIIFTRYLAAAVHSDRATIHLRDIPSPAWERVFLFRPYTSPEQISAALGFAWSGSEAETLSITEAYNLLLFVNGNTVVLSVLHPRHEGDFVPASKDKSFRRDDAEFRIRYQAEDDHWPLLEPAPPSQSQPRAAGFPSVNR